jgi:hypothetical protein
MSNSSGVGLTVAPRVLFSPSRLHARVSSEPPTGQTRYLVIGGRFWPSHHDTRTSPLLDVIRQSIGFGFVTISPPVTMRVEALPPLTAGAHTMIAASTDRVEEHHETVLLYRARRVGMLRGVGLVGSLLGLVLVGLGQGVGGSAVAAGGLGIFVSAVAATADLRRDVADGWSDS